MRSLKVIFSVLVIGFTIFSISGCQSEQSTKESSSKNTSVTEADASRKEKNISKDYLEKLVRENFASLDVSKESKEDSINRVLEGESSIGNYFDKLYPDKSNEDKLAIEIELVEYLNSRNQLMDNKDSFYKMEYYSMVMDKEIKKAGIDGDIKTSDGLEYISKNADKIAENYGLDKQTIIDMVNSSKAENLSEQKN